MTSTLVSESILTRRETDNIRDGISERMLRLDRCRAIFDVQISDACRAIYKAAPGMPEHCRIVYQRAGEQIWQVTAFGEDGRILSDSTRDGMWIEAGGQRWNHRYLSPTQNDAVHELDGVSAKEAERIETQRDARGSQLSSLLWPMDVAIGHLYAHMSSLTAPLSWDTWQFQRNSKSGQLTCRSHMDYYPTEFRFSTWEYCQWRFAKLWDPGADILEYFGKKSLPRTEIEFILNETHGYLPEQFRMIDHLGPSDGKDSLEAWSDPVSCVGGLNLPRTHQVYGSYADDEVYCRSTLIPEESAFGANIPLEIRPIDCTLKCVDW